MNEIVVAPAAPNGANGFSPFSAGYWILFGGWKEIEQGIQTLKGILWLIRQLSSCSTVF